MIPATCKKDISCYSVVCQTDFLVVMIIVSNHVAYSANNDTYLPHDYNNLSLNTKSRLVADLTESILFALINPFMTNCKFYPNRG